MSHNNKINEIYSITSNTRLKLNEPGNPIHGNNTERCNTLVISTNNSSSNKRPNRGRRTLLV